MPDILIVKDGSNFVPKLGVTDAQRLDWMRTFAIYDINADGSKSGPYGPTDPAKESVKAFAEVDTSGNPTGQIVTPDGDVVEGDTGRFNVMAFGARCDCRVVNDATMGARTGAGNVPVTSATIAFTSADVGKLVGVIPDLTTVTTGYPITRGTIVSVESATSATVSVPGTVSAVASNGSLIVGSDDSNAIDFAISAASVAGGVVYFPGMSAVSRGFQLPVGVNARGSGMGLRHALQWTRFGSGMTYLGAYSASGSLLILNQRAAFCDDMTLDAAGGMAQALDMQGTGGSTGMSAVRVHPAGGHVYTVKMGASSRLMNSEVNGRFRGTVVQMGGDCRVVNGNHIYGAGDNLPVIEMNDPTDDAQLAGNHLYRNGWGSTPSANPGVMVHLKAFGTATATGGMIALNHFDTMEGHGILIEVFNNSAGRPGVQGLSINNNQFFQPLTGVTTDTYSLIKVKCGTGGANPARIRGLSVVGNVAKGTPGTAQGQASGTTKRWKSVIDWEVQATQGELKAVTVVGNAATDCQSVYSTSGAAYSPTYSAGNVIFDGAAESTA